MSQANGTSWIDTFGDVVYVSTNYRLNVFGFLGSEQLRSRDPEGSTGNYGLQCIAACRPAVQGPASTCMMQRVAAYADEHKLCLRCDVERQLRFSEQRSPITLSCRCMLA